MSESQCLGAANGGARSRDRAGLRAIDEERERRGRLLEIDGDKAVVRRNGRNELLACEARNDVAIRSREGDGPEDQLQGDELFDDGRRDHSRRVAWGMAVVRRRDVRPISTGEDSRRALQPPLKECGVVVIGPLWVARALK